ncbi:MAG: class I tRNA ligase family protein, partial [Methanomassiliicoccales archaeon]
SRERERMRKRLIRFSTENPLNAVEVLLKHYFHPEERVRENVRSTLEEIVSSTGKEALLDNLKTPNRRVRRAVISYLEDRHGGHAVTYGSFFEQTWLLLAMAKKKEIPVEDIERLAEVSKSVFLEGDTIKAVHDIATCLDLVKHRHRSVEQLKGYLVDVLKLAPELTRMGLYSGNIEEAARKAMKASKQRTYDETGEIIRERREEGRLREQLDWLGGLVHSAVREPPELEPSEIEGTDVWVIKGLEELINSVTSTTLAGEGTRAMEHLCSFIEEDLRGVYEENLAQRVKEGDESASLTLYTASLVCLKLAAPLMPTAAEEVYQNDFREHEEEPTVHVVRWPDIVMRLMG